ncbi:MAG: hypothetical protein ACREPV_01185 [Lysobacter sp.]
MAKGADKAGNAVEKAGKQADDSAERHARLTAAAKNAGTILGTVLVGGAVAASAAVLAWSRDMAVAGKELTVLAALSNTSVENFQRQAAAAKTVGIEQEQLAAIYKDTQEKVGEFINTGGGELIDFFKEVAPLTGVTADQFRELSGPDALQLFFSSLEKANLSQSQTIAYMEAMADDASVLAPLLRDNGAAAKEFGDQASRLGAILDEEALEKAAALQEELAELDLVLLALKRQIAEEAIPVIRELAETLSGMAGDSDGVAEVLESIGAGFDVVVGAAKVTSSVVRGITLDLIALANAGQAGFDALTGDWEGAAQNMREARIAREMAAEESADIARVFGGGSPAPASPSQPAPDIIDVMMRPLEAPKAKPAAGGGKPSGGGGAAAVKETKAAVEELSAAELDLIAIQGIWDQAEVDRSNAAADRWQQEKEVAAARAEVYEGMKADMQFELELLGMTNAEREIAIAQRRAGVDAMSAEGEELAGLTKELIAAREQAELLDTIKYGLADVFVGFAKGAKEGEQAWDSFMDSLFERALQFAADKAIDALFSALDGGGGGGTGAAGAGGGGSGWAGLFSSLLGAFGGGRDAGGAVQAGSFYRVNENRNELLTVGGETFLMMGKQGGRVDANRGGGRGGDVFNITIPVEGRVDRQTRGQVANETAARLQTWTGRNR